MTTDRWIIGVPLLLVLFYGLIGWCLTISDPEQLAEVLDQRDTPDTAGPTRRFVVTAWVLLRRVAIWPAWYR